MNFYRPDKFDPAGVTVPLDAAPDADLAASEKAKTLRARALRYRQLCTTFYDQGLVAEVECLARELEERATKLEVGSYSFFRGAMRASAGGKY